MLVKGLLILVLIGCGFCLRVSAQPPAKPAAADTLKPTPADTTKPDTTKPDTLTPVLPKFNTIDPATDTLGPAPGDTAKPAPADSPALARDSLTLARDSIRRRDSIRQADYVPTAAALQRQIDSA
ncbi:MAG TPA: hypothetical protein VKR41_09020, partial [Puia sp.]|nr:hypothetical protein [Puia sp.]